MDLAADSAFISNSTNPTRSSTPVPSSPSSSSKSKFPAQSPGTPTSASKSTASGSGSGLKKEIGSPADGEKPDVGGRRDSSSTIRPSISSASGSGGAGDDATTATTTSGQTSTSNAAAAAPGAGPGVQGEVDQVVQQLSSWGGSFWGGFKKQGASALDAVRKDFARTVSEASDELKALQEQTASFEVKPPVALGSIEEGLKNLVKDLPGGGVDKGKGKEKAEAQGDGEKREGIDGDGTAKQTQASEFFKSLQTTLQAQSTSLNANLTSLTNQINHTLSTNPQLAQLSQTNISALSTTIQANLEKAGTRINLKQAEKLAEEYLKKGEGLIGEAGTFLKDAVKVVPPTGDGAHGVSWDGSDIGLYSNILSPKDGKSRSTSLLFDRSQSLSRSSADLSRSQLRLQALLRRLRTDEELLLNDPEGDEESEGRRAAFRKFRREVFEERGGMAGEGGEVQKMIWGEMGPQAEEDKGGVEGDVEGLKRMKDALVPSKLTEEEFWIRYFYYKQTIEEEEKKRQELLQAATTQPEKEEEFSWDDAEDDSVKSPVESTAPVPAPKSETSTSTPVPASSKTFPTPAVDTSAPAKPSTATASTPTVADAGLASPSMKSVTESNTSRRVSEESYDIVNDQNGGNKKAAAGMTAAAPAPALASVSAGKKGAKAPAQASADDDEDSDWE